MCCVCSQPATHINNNVFQIRFNNGDLFRGPSSLGPCYYCDEHFQESKAVPLTAEDLENLPEKFKKMLSEGYQDDSHDEKPLI